MNKLIRIVILILLVFSLLLFLFFFKIMIGEIVFSVPDETRSWSYRFGKISGTIIPAVLSLFLMMYLWKKYKEIPK